MSALALRGPARVVVLQHRRVLWITGALALAGIAVLAIGVWWTSGDSDSFADTGCSFRNTSTRCIGAVNDFVDSEIRFNHLLQYAGVAMMVLPAAVGLFVAGPMIGRELEDGTYRLSWSQSVTPNRWLAAKLAVPAVLTVAGVSVLSAVYAWAWSRARGTNYPVQWFEPRVYGAMGPAPVGYALLCLALGALAAVLIRRTLPAMAVTAVAYAAVVLVMNSVRSGLWPMRTDTTAPGREFRYPSEASDVSVGWMTGGGARLDDATCISAGDFDGCMARHGAAAQYVDYHPASHFWPLQLIETGILLVLAAAMVAVAFRVLRRSHG
ncbi:ABC transporter permease subunit [Streptomyces laculatispora]|uniref:ABC transporter permease subunit n=1 Tax=Streptomyces laculatispora TaxID=887464 RepID=A0ABY9I4D8_9ACTN|nr:ABC transporter permease subunit [Streptomyces laculatispora]WLQ41737.1 ABC transporter permease subunit [Streptomyces laculatispora]